MDVVAIMEAPAEQGVTVLVEADAERMAERRKPWTFVAIGAPLHEGVEAWPGTPARGRLPGLAHEIG
ncbi:hypothetical protein ACFUAC_15145 [Streptomyces sp. NPDC057148]|uniref:hypothetical protein n=1 Tax=unclassified Streptomyces TaxID=2593676 RepID=UPI0036436D1B